MNPTERMIVALDYENDYEALRLINDLNYIVESYKLGHEAVCAGWAQQIADILKKRGKRIFWDLKMYGTEDTLGRAVAGLSLNGGSWVTISAHSGRKAISAAVRGRGDIAVLVVDSLTSHELSDTERDEKAVRTARLALECGAQGIVCSYSDAGTLLKHKEFNPLLKFIPGIRPSWYCFYDNHKKPVWPGTAISFADYIIVGRPITNSRLAGRSEVEAARAIIEEIARVGRIIELKPKS